MKALEIIDLVKTYPTGVKAVQGINLTVEQGDFYALLGHNGAGKSTTIGIISALVNKTSGQVKVFGYDLDSDKAALKQQIGLVPQEFNFNQFERVIDVLVQQAGFYGINKSEALKRAEIWLKKLNLWEKRTHLTLELRRSLWQFLRELNEQGTTVILTTHYLEEAENLCRHIGIIQHGQLIENTTMKALLATLENEFFVLDVQKNVENRPLVIDGYAHRWLDENTLEVEVKRQQGLNKLFEQFSQQGIEVLSMRNRANRLEELFINMAD